MIHPGQINMTRLGELLIEADKLPKIEGAMVISTTGVLSISARALREMSAPPDTDSVDVQEAHQERLLVSQPKVYAGHLEDMAKHLGQLADAVKEGNAGGVAEFFNLYVID